MYHQLASAALGIKLQPTTTIQTHRQPSAPLPPVGSLPFCMWYQSSFLTPYQPIITHHRTNQSLLLIVPTNRCCTSFALRLTTATVTCTVQSTTADGMMIYTVVSFIIHSAVVKTIGCCGGGWRNSVDANNHRWC